MRNVLFAVAAASLACAGPALADTINFGQFGPNSSAVADLAMGVTSGGTQFTVTDLALGFQRLDEGNGWSGEFVAGTPLLFDNGAAGPVTLTFLTPLAGLSGISAQANFTGFYTATETFLGVGNVVLGVETYNGDNELGPEGTIPVFGAFNAGGPLITAVVYTTTNDGAGFALGGSGGATVPEPAAWAMMLVGFGLVGGAMRRRSATALTA